MTQLRETIEDVIKLLNSSSRAKELMQVWPKIIKLDMEGENESLYLCINNGQMELKTDTKMPVDIVVSGRSQAFIDVMLGRKDITYSLAVAELVIDRQNIPDMITFSRIMRTQEKRR